jgi:hypothetical protein
MPGSLQAAGAAVIVVLEAGYDSETRPLSKARQRLLHPGLRARDPSARIFVGPDATAANLAAATAWAGADLVTASGHGTAEALVEFGGLRMLLDCSAQLPPLPNCIVQVTSCDCGWSLGPALVAKGCKAFIGYDDKLLLPQDDADFGVVAACDGAVVQTLLAGGTAAEAWTAAKERYAATALSLRNTGQTLLAGLLEVDSRRLVSPANRTGLGDPEARLS